MTAPTELIETVLVLILLLLIFLAFKAFEIVKSLDRINGNLRIACTVIQESPEERAEREGQDLRYVHTPNLTQKKHSPNGVPFNVP
jgi:hypothetical protein